MKKRTVALLIVLPLLLAAVSLFIGRYTVTPSDVLHALLPFTGETTIENSAVVLQLRLPRIIAAAFVGAALAASGTAFQGVFHNPLVSSGLLGVSAGAGFGAALAIVLFSSAWATYPFAFLFGILAVLLSYWVARIYKTVPTIMLVLGGTIVSSIFNALISLLKYVADADRQLPAIVYWLMGSLSDVGYSDFWALIPIGAGLIALLLLRWDINVLSMGDKQAKSLGVNVRRSKTAVIAAAALATAGAVCLSGVVGWVGLVIPHIGRLLAGNDNRRLMPVSIAIGAGFMIAIDTISRMITASEVPLGILTALIGAPFFIFLLKKTKGGGWRE
ncbi:MAG: iron ABC transporter permease [Oscillospiraceae bacterium]|nr:iron ABC transporter permease [Oscillospiraceae bacterium]